MRATEQTLEHELAPILGERFGASIVTQGSHSAGRGRKQSDTILKFPDGRKIVLELEVGESHLLGGVVQAEGYVSELGADGSITIAYPNNVRREVDTRQDVLDLVTGTKFAALVLTPFLRQNFSSISLDDFCDQFNKARTEPKPTDLNLVVSVLRQSVESLALKMRRGRGVKRPVLERVVSQFDLFSALSGEGGEPDKEELAVAASDLAAYVVVNQILLYFLLKDSLGFPEFLPLKSTAELRRYFDRVTAIDYKAVYSVDIVFELPRQCLPEINKVIIAFRQLKPEGMQHDLLGRMFHEFLPFKTRKIFATFYTKPVAAEMLARLAIDSETKNVIEPSCGSGTLLVASYQALRHRKPKLTHNEILQQLYAVDIMPFAAHLAALNLTLQDLGSQTEKVNASVGNSLNLVGRGGLRTQQDFFNKILSRRVDLEKTHEEEFLLPEQADVVIMNPPYTDQRYLTVEMLGTRASAFNDRQNYWAYFLSVADDLLAPGGIIAAVLPRLFLAGSTSKEVRQWIFNTRQYNLLYIVRTTKEFAFSEAAAFRDFLFVLQKPDPKAKQPSPHCKVVYLNRSIDELSIAESGEISDAVRETHVGRNQVETADFTLFTVPQEIIRRRSDNLWFTVGFENPRNAEIITRLWEKLFDVAGSRLASLQNALGVRTKRGLQQFVPRGFEANPPGLYSSIFAVRSLSGDRVSAADLIINKETEDFLKCAFNEQEIKLPKKNLQQGIKTASYFRRFVITPDYCDWIIKERCDASPALQRLSGVRANFAYIEKSIEKCKTHLLVARKVNLVAPGTTFLAFYSENEVASPKTFYSVRCSKAQSLALTLWMNSIFGIIQVLGKRMETEGAYGEVLKEDLGEFFVPNEKSIPEQLKTWFEDPQEMEFPPLADQFTSQSERRGLDREIMRWMNWPESEIEADLDAFYRVLTDEFQLMRHAARAGRIEPPKEEQFL